MRRECTKVYVCEYATVCNAIIYLVPLFYCPLGLLKLGFRTTFSVIADQLNKYIKFVNI